MPDRIWEFERSKTYSKWTRGIEEFAALEYPKESVSAVLRLIEPEPAPQALGSRRATRTVPLPAAPAAPSASRP